MYSAGVVVYEMLAGINPFAGKTVASTLHNVLHRQPPHLIEQRPSLPSELCHAVMACLARDPAQRPRDVTRLLDVVRRVRAAGPDQVGRTLSPHVQATASLRLAPLRAARRRPRWLAVAGATTVLLAAALTWSRARDVAGPTEPKPSEAAPLAGVPQANASPTATPGLALPTPVASRAPSAAPRAVPAQAASSPRPAAVTPTPLAAALAAMASPVPTAPPSAAPSPVPTPSSPAQVFVPAASPSPVLAALRALTPRRAGRRETVNLEIRGSGLRPDHRVRVMRGQGEAQGIHVVREQRVDDELLRVTLLVDEDVPPGLYSVLLVDAQARTTNSLSLEVTL